MLIIKNLNLYHPSKPKQLLLKDINLSLDSSSNYKVALLGPNGSGKTTLIKAIMSSHKNIYISNEKILYLAQHNTYLQTDLVKNILYKFIDVNIEFYKLEIVFAQIGISIDNLNKPISNLSGGEILKIRLAELLLQEPTILILDEPTNHLDQDSKDFLSNFIQEFQGSVLIVSHDRDFLEETTSKVWAIKPHNKYLEVFTGKYSDWRIHNQKQTNTNNQEYQKINSQIKTLESWINANQSHPKYRFSSIVQTKKQKLAKLQNQISELNLISRKQIKLNSENNSSKHKSNLLINYDFKNHPILKYLKSKIHNNDSILIEGANGSGKTTFLKELQTESQYITHNKKITFASLDQISKYNPNQKVKDIIFSLSSADQKTIYQKIYQLNLKHILKTQYKNISGGERKRLQIAILLSTPADIYLLDEPTNHLDIYTQELVQEFIKKLTKPFLLISHDKFLKRSIVFTKNINLLNNA